MASPSPIRIATRSSALALWQANHIADQLRGQNTDQTVELVEVSTQGDQVQNVSLKELGGQGVFTREVQRAVLDQRADLAVHSLKDLPTEMVMGLSLAAVPVRANPYDALVFPAGQEPIPLENLPPGTRVGTGSPRRQAQLLFANRDLEILPIRGNVDTRLQKLDAGEYDVIVLAMAGLTRLGWAERISLELGPPVVFPAVGQGALGLECRADDQRVKDSLTALNHPQTHHAVKAERTLLAELRAGCHAPLGVHTTLNPETVDELHLRAVVLETEGKQRLMAEATGPAADPAAIGMAVAEKLYQQGVEKLLR